jgi:hypothetical protein
VSQGALLLGWDPARVEERVDEAGREEDEEEEEEEGFALDRAEEEEEDDDVVGREEAAGLAAVVDTSTFLVFGAGRDGFARTLFLSESGCVGVRVGEREKEKIILCDRKMAQYWSNLLL